MSDIKLFRFSKEGATALSARTALVERELHDLMEKHMQCFLGIRFVAHEFSTGKVHRGRIDSLGLDENNCPVILEYKRHVNENVINQGLYYLDWLMDHQADFKLLVLERYGQDMADAIEWQGTRVLCVAGDFTKFDEHAVAQIGRNIELIRYKYFGDDLLMLEWLNPVQSSIEPVGTGKQTIEATGKNPQSGACPESPDKNTGCLTSQLATMPDGQRTLYDELYRFVTSLGDDVNSKELRRYIAFARLKNFACLAPMKGWFKLWLHLAPDSVPLEEGFSRDVSKTGHWGTGDIEINLRTLADFDKVKPLLERAYLES
ncbi:DUF5655 domain-containing protein [uncultured Desulfovibrio sp.]|uniref:DUF5655 domain-containing protein n=1 Tax=uncultured Desulfovibrio sp. TaxID=167968 RepID=UPI002610D147|nr:DUF5655 domain-containing protein [uncultured Desulfovibrio sp.]